MRGNPILRMPVLILLVNVMPVKVAMTKTVRAFERTTVGASADSRTNCSFVGIESLLVSTSCVSLREMTSLCDSVSERMIVDICDMVRK